MTPLTVSRGKKAVLVRLPDPVMALLDRMAKSSRKPRTIVLYRILSRSTQLKSVRKHLEALCRKKKHS